MAIVKKAAPKKAAKKAPASKKKIYTIQDLAEGKVQAKRSTTAWGQGKYVLSLAFPNDPIETVSSSYYYMRGQDGELTYSGSYRKGVPIQEMGLFVLPGEQEDWKTENVDEQMLRDALDEADSRVASFIRRNINAYQLLASPKFLKAAYKLVCSEWQDRLRDEFSDIFEDVRDLSKGEIDGREIFALEDDDSLLTVAYKGQYEGTGLFLNPHYDFSIVTDEHKKKVLIFTEK